MRNNFRESEKWKWKVRDNFWQSEKWEVTFGKLVVGEVMATRGCHPGGLVERRGIK